MLPKVVELHGEDIHAAVWVWYLGPNSRQCVFMCVYVCVCLCVCACVGVCPHIFPPIWVWFGHLLFHACILTHFWFCSTLWFSCLCGQSVLWLGPTLGLCFFFVLFFFFFAPVQSSGVLSSLSVLFGPVTLANCPRFDLLQHPVSDWPLDPAKRGCVCLARCEYAQRYRGEARTQMRPPEVGAEDFWCMRSSAVVCLRVYFSVLEAVAGRWRGELWFGSSEGA